LKDSFLTNTQYLPPHPASSSTSSPKRSTSTERPPTSTRKTRVEIPCV
jgi:hypothetical protein